MPPAAAIESTVAAARAPSRSTTRTRSPRAARWRAADPPMSPPPPVTIAFLPSMSPPCSTADQQRSVPGPPPRSLRGSPCAWPAARQAAAAASTSTIQRPYPDDRGSASARERRGARRSARSGRLSVACGYLDARAREDFGIGGSRTIIVQNADARDLGAPTTPEARPAGLSFRCGHDGPTPGNGATD